MPHDDEVAVGAEVADLVRAIELAHGGLLGHVGVEGEGGRGGAEVRGLAGDEGISLLAGAGPARGPALPVREQRGEARADITAARHRAEVVEAPEDVEPSQRLQDAQIERGRADAAARQREPDWARALGGVGGGRDPRQHPASREIAPFPREHAREVEQVGVHAPDAVGQPAHGPRDGEHRFREEDELARCRLCHRSPPAARTAGRARRACRGRRGSRPRRGGRRRPGSRAGRRRRTAARSGGTT